MVNQQTTMCMSALISPKSPISSLQGGPQKPVIHVFFFFDPYNWPYKWITGGNWGEQTLLIGVISIISPHL